MPSAMPTCLLSLLGFLVALPAQAQDMLREGPGSAYYIPPINPLPHWYEVRGGSWRVPLSTVQELRTLIEGEIARNKYFYPEGTAPGYAIQFRGETLEGAQVVRLAGACNGLGKWAWRLSEQFNRVEDGGKCYFEADFRLEDRRLRFGYHGRA
jgi:hypothetical protein